MVPDVPSINHILAKHSVGYELQPPDLISRNLKAIIPVQDRPPSLDDEAHEIIRLSLNQAEENLALGRGRQAVQEILWLLETVSTSLSRPSHRRYDGAGQILQ